MAAYFFDSSAIVKRYHRELGTPWVQAICEPRVHPPLYLSHLAHVEVVAAPACRADPGVTCRVR